MHMDVDNAKWSERLPSIKQDQQQLYLPPRCGVSHSHGTQLCRQLRRLLVFFAQHGQPVQRVGQRLQIGPCEQELQPQQQRLLCPPHYGSRSRQRTSHAGRHHRRHRHVGRSAQRCQLRDNGRVMGCSHQQDRAHLDGKRGTYKRHHPCPSCTGSLHGESGLCGRHKECRIRRGYRICSTRNCADTRCIYAPTMERQSGYRCRVQDDAFPFPRTIQIGKPAVPGQR